MHYALNNLKRSASLNGPDGENSSSSVKDKAMTDSVDAGAGAHGAPCSAGSRWSAFELGGAFVR